MRCEPLSPSLSFHFPLRLVLQGLFVLAGLLVVNGLGSPCTLGQDWNQWQGPQRNGRWETTGTLDKFAASGPNYVWRQKISNGYSGPAVAGGKVVVLDYVRSDGDDTPNPGTRGELKGKERVQCLSAVDGKVLWTREYDCAYSISYPNGPRATPVIDGDRVYTLGAEGNLVCWELASGKIVWEKSLKVEYKLENAPHWGFAAHPLIDGDTLYCIVGGEGSVAVAFDKSSGKELWRSLSAPVQGYCPPTMVTANGYRTLLIWHSKAINGLNPETGELYWSFDLEPAYEMPIIAPIQSGNLVLATALQGTSLLIELGDKPTQAKEIWRGKGIHSDHNPPLIVDGHIYGVSERGQLRCCELETGNELWESLATANNGRPVNSGTGFMVLGDGKYFMFIETGELVIARLSPTGCEELDRAKILEPTSRTGSRKVVWSHPAFAGTRMYVRNDQEIVCVELGAK
ncbi:MAG: PQQ-like beta-propeller repeat protein [Planctomycetaceae bacterium]|nr:PQQ-like beta-propeller repeat protein [Planctomycetaceae bacterium]